MNDIYSAADIDIAREMWSGAPSKRTVSIDSETLAAVTDAGYCLEDFNVVTRPTNAEILVEIERARTSRRHVFWVGGRYRYSKIADDDPASVSQPMFGKTGKLIAYYTRTGGHPTA